MRHFPVRTVAIAAFAMLALAACGSSSKSSTASNSASSPTTAGSSSGYGAPVTSPPTTAAATTTKALVSLAAVNNTSVDKKVLVDKNGMTLYVWDNDKTPGKASCTGASATAWPPLYVTGTPAYGAGVPSAMFSTVTGPNGSKQLAVNGKPLYTWAADKKAGDATGQGVNGFYVVAADGNKVDAS